MAFAWPEGWVPSLGVFLPSATQKQIRRELDCSWIACYWQQHPRQGWAPWVPSRKISHGQAGMGLGYTSEASFRFLALRPLGMFQPFAGNHGHWRAGRRGSLPAAATDPPADPTGPAAGVRPRGGGGPSAIRSERPSTLPRREETACRTLAASSQPSARVATGPGAASEHAGRRGRGGCSGFTLPSWKINC